MVEKTIIIKRKSYKMFIKDIKIGKDNHIVGNIDSYNTIHSEECSGETTNINLYKNQKILTPKGAGLKKAKKVFKTFKNNYEKRKNEV